MKTKLILLLTLTSLIVFGQEKEEKEMKTIFGGKNFTSGGYGAVELKMGEIKGETELLVGGRGGWVINHNFALGGGGYGMVTRNSFNHYDEKEERNYDLMMETGYGGLMLEFIPMSHKVVHFAVPVLIGAGGVAVVDEHDRNFFEDDDEDDWYVYESSAFFVLEPAINIELNIIKYMRINLGGSYRYVAGSELKCVTDNDLTGFTGNIAFKFGVF